MTNEHAHGLVTVVRSPGDLDTAFGPVLLLGEVDPAFGPIVLPGDTQAVDQGGSTESPADDPVVCPHSSFVQALHGLLADIGRKEGLVVLTGEAGTGKSVLLQRTTEDLTQDGTTVLHCDARMSFGDFIAYCCAALGIVAAPADDDTPPDQFQMLVDYLLARRVQSRALVVIVDDAQEMSEDLLAELILLSKWPTAGKDVLQLVLAGQPSLQPLLDGMVVRELVAPDYPTYVLAPLTPDEVRGFVSQYYGAADNDATQLFSPESLDLIAAYSRGIPRFILTLCHVAVVKAALEGKSVITPELIAEESRSVCADDHAPQSKGDTAAKNARPAARAFPRLAAVPGPGATNEAAHKPERVEELQHVLHRLRGECPGIEACALISDNGAIIASTMPRNVDDGIAAGMTAALLRLGTQLAEELGQGTAQDVIVRSDRGFTVAVRAGKQAVLLVLASEVAPLGLMLFEIGESVAVITRLR
jgi:general secretion pathway protein A